VAWLISGDCPISPLERPRECGGVKTTQKHSSHASPAPQPMEQDPFYGHSGWVDPQMKHTAAQENRRSSQHRGKTIKRPQQVTRTMGT
jgi:hypothetical protein